jgi:hypothetical protein
MNGNPWFELLVPYKYRRWRETEEAAAEPAPAEARPHEWRVINGSVRLAAGDRGVLQRCVGCGSERIVVEDEHGTRRILLDHDFSEFCPAG